MILASRRLRAILVLPVLAYGFAILLSQALLFGQGRASYWGLALFLGVVLIALMRTRVVRRAGEWLEILSLRGRTRVLAREYLLHFEIHVTGRFGTMQWKLACAKHPQRSLEMGSLLLGARRGVDSARRALDLQITFETEAMLHAAEKAGGATPRRHLVILGVLIATAVVLAVWSSGSRTVAMRPGSYNVDLWIPGRACWARTRVLLVAGNGTSARCEDLASAVECLPGEAPITNRRSGQSRPW